MRRFGRCLAAVLVVLLTIGIGGAQAQITTKEDWDRAFAAKYGEPYEMDRLLSQTGYDDSQERFAWHGNYWLRAFVSMTETFDDTGYLDKAVRLIDYMLYYRDDARADRGELDISAEPYGIAPPKYLSQRDKAAPGWRRTSGETRILTLDDGQNTNGIMRFVRLVYGNSKYEAYQSKARAYLERVIETVNSHNETFVFDKHPAVPGSYYPPRRYFGIFSGELPYNQSATMGITLILLDDVLGGKTQYASMAKALVDYWLNYVDPTDNDTYVWDYDLAGRLVGGRVEDIGHAHIDVGFLLLAHDYGLGPGAEEMATLARTWVRSIYRGDGELAANVDGSGVSKEPWNAGFDWIDLARFDPAVLDIAIEVFTKDYATPAWARPYLGWAEIMRWRKATGRLPEPDATPAIVHEPVDFCPPLSGAVCEQRDGR